LALFGRQPPERVDGPVMLASENLHNALNRCAIARCAVCVTASAVRKGEKVDSGCGGLS